VSELIPHTARLVPYAKRPKQASGFVTAYYYEPLAADPGFDRGNLYAVIEVLVSGRASEEVANLIIDTIGDYYYNQPDSAHTSPSDRFEGAIRAANHELGAHVNRGNAAWIGKLSAVVAIEIGAELHVAQSGSGEAFLYREMSHTRITTPAPNRPASPTKTFGSIASGQLEAGDRVLLATPALIHQVPIMRLQSIIGQSSPNAAIAEITALLREVTTERIAALIIEITTPELAALKVRPEQPNEIHLSPGESPLEVAIQVAQPIAHTTANSSKKVTGIIISTWSKAQPRLQIFGLSLAEYTRNLLATRRGRLIAAVVLVVLILLTTGLIWFHSSTKSNSQLMKNYQTAYTNYTKGQELAAENEKSAAQQELESAQSKASSLSIHQSTLDRQLTNSKNLAASEPRTLSGLQSLIANALNQISDLTEVNSTTVTTFPGAKAAPQQFEIYRGRGYFFDANDQNQLSIVNLTSGSITNSSAQTQSLGVVIDTTLAGSNSGIFVLTNAPAVWFYSFNTDSLTKEATSTQWPKAQAIGSFGTNLYLLVNGSVIKYTKTGSGYSTGSVEMSSASGTSATALAVDGSIYIATSTNLNRYFGGVLAQTLTVPQGLTELTHLRSTTDNTLIIATDPTTARIGLWSATPSTLTFNQQLGISHATKIYAATYDPTTGLIYATTTGKLLSFPYTK
jgi:hypothetical protein